MLNYLWNDNNHCMETINDINYHKNLFNLINTNIFIWSLQTIFYIILN